MLSACIEEQGQCIPSSYRSGDQRSSPARGLRFIKSRQPLRDRKHPGPLLTGPPPPYLSDVAEIVPFPGQPMPAGLLGAEPAHEADSQVLSGW